MNRTYTDRAVSTDRHRRHFLALGHGAFLGLVLLSACGSAPAPSSKAAAVSAPTYQQLFEHYFAPGTPGHCATAGCHADPGHNVWLCSRADDCYQGMVDVGLIDLDAPTESEIANPTRSPLTWINPAGGNMPLDAQTDNAAGRAAIEAWVAAGAAND